MINLMSAERGAETRQPGLDAVEAMDKEMKTKLSDREAWPDSSETDFSETEVQGLKDLHEMLSQIPELDESGFISASLAQTMLLIPGPAWLVDNGGDLGKADREEIITTMEANLQKVDDFMEWLKPNATYKHASDELKKEIDDLAEGLKKWVEQAKSE
jgi:hypothetical protein